MRDPERIERIVQGLEAYWQDNPDLRLAQIVGNIGQSSGHGTDPYYMEDARIEQFLRREGYIE